MFKVSGLTAALVLLLLQPLTEDEERMALRDTLEYERQFSSMPTDWRDRPDNGVTTAGEFARVGPGQSWIWDGQLVLGTKPDPDEPGHYVVGQVESIPTFSPFGFWEARVKFPVAPGVLAGWWLQSEKPYATPQDVEIDIAENAGNPNVTHTLWYTAAGQPAGQYTKVTVGTTDLGAGIDEPQADWHTYGCRVTPTGYTFYVDGVQKFQTWSGLTNTPHRMVFSLKVPGYLVDNLNPDTTDQNRMKVDWVRKYAP